MRVTAEIANKLSEIGKQERAVAIALTNAQAAERTLKEEQGKLASLKSGIINEITEEHGEWLVEERGVFFRINKYKAGLGINSIRIEQVRRYGC